MIKKLNTIPRSEWPKIWCTLNVWQFPPELIEFKPENWELLPMLMKAKVIDECIKYIIDQIPEKELMRCWNKDMSDVDFEVWWANKPELSDDAIELLKSLYKKETSFLN